MYLYSKRRASSYQALWRGFYIDVVNTEILKFQSSTELPAILTGSSRFFSVNSGKFRDTTSIRPQSLHSNMFTIHYLHVTAPFVAIYLAILTASQINNKNLHPTFAQITCSPSERQQSVCAQIT
jgi:hypothetical protein